MAEALALAILAAWMWRERENARERQALLEKLTGAQLLPAKPEPVVTLPPAYGTDAYEWEIEQERKGL